MQGVNFPLKGEGENREGKDDPPPLHRADGGAGRCNRENEMAFVPAANTLRVTLEFTYQGHVVVNVFYLRKSSPIVAVDLTNVAASLKAWWNTYIKVIVPQAVIFTNVTLRDMTTETGQQLDSDVNPPNVGAVVGQALPNNVTLVTGFRTGLTGRSTRGRVYNVGILEADTDLNNVTLGVAVAWATAWVNLNPAVVALNFVHVIASFITGGVPRVGALTTPVISYVANVRVDTQRRRLPD